MNRRQELISYILEKQAGSYDAYNTDNYTKSDTAREYMDSQYGKVKKEPKSTVNFEMKGGPKTVHETKRPPKQEVVVAQPNFRTKGDPYFNFSSKSSRKGPKVVNVKYVEGPTKSTSKFKNLKNNIKGNIKPVLKSAGRAGLIGVAAGTGAYLVGKNAGRNESQQQDYERTASMLGDICMEKQAMKKMKTEKNQDKEASILLDGLYKQATLGLGGVASKISAGVSGLSNAVNAASPFAKATVRDAAAAMPKTPATTPSINPPGGVGTTTANIKPVAASAPTDVTTTSSVGSTSKQADELIDTFEKSLQKCASEWFGEELQPKDSEYMANKRLYVDLFNSPNIQW